MFRTERLASFTFTPLLYTKYSDSASGYTNSDPPLAASDVLIAETQPPELQTNFYHSFILFVGLLSSGNPLLLVPGKLDVRISLSS